MVMHVEVRHENSFFSMDDSINVILLDSEDRDGNSDSDSDGVINGPLGSKDVNVSWMLTSSSTNTSTSTIARDTSTTCRDASLDNTRQTVNTQTSILDLTKEEDEDEDDEEEDDSSVLFQDLRESDPCRLQEDARQEETGTAVAEKVASNSSLLGRFSPDRFFDSLCSSTTTTTVSATPTGEAYPTPSSSSSSRRVRRTFAPSCSSTACIGVSCIRPGQTHSQDQDDLEADGSTANANASNTAAAVKSASSLSLAGDRLAVEHDVWNLLGCARPPDILELEAIWNLTTTTAADSVCSHRTRPSNANSTKRPLRASLKDRMHRIQRLRQHRWAGATRHGVTLSQHGPYSPSISLRAVSMDYLDTKDYSNWMDSSIDLSAASLANAMGLSTRTCTSSNRNKSQHANHNHGRSSLSPARTSGSALQRTAMGTGSSYRHGYREQYQGGADLTYMKVDGYDSDPELGGSNTGAACTAMEQDMDHYEDVENRNNNYQNSGEDRVLADQHHHPLPKVEANMDQFSPQSEDEEFVIYQTVQQTLNSTWTLTWHPNAHNVKEFHIAPKPFMINIWMERGTVITHNGVVIEPMFMWRDAYQSHYLLQQRKRLNPTCQKPWSMRLLNTCRITPATSLDKNKYPLARKAHCLLVKTCQGQEFLLEANSGSQMELICERWKITVARFASLAVTEDIDAIAQEFFHPTLSAQTLTVQQQQHQQQLQQRQQPHELPVEEEGLYMSSSSSSSSTDPSGSSSAFSGSTPQRATPQCTTNHVPIEEVAPQRRWIDI